ncbi:MAG: ABC transporter substrate-binding protein [Candidatus Desulfatibia sp.]|uniref:MlaC/ttg2D family ABC transporter substrate-binding protein n=1 Tax=Candidatus Desulfatibia sp. TaxID=3101189 RepID=UPI002F2F1C81
MAKRFSKTKMIQKIKIKELILKSLLYVMISLLVLSQTAAADNKSAAEVVLKSKLEAILALLQQKELEQQAKTKEAVKIIEAMFDFPLMARLTLKKYWAGLDQEKKERFIELFKKNLKEFYLETLNLYTDEKIVYKAPVQGKKKRKVLIPTELISKGERISMDYKLYRSKNNWKIYDVEIKGTSIIRTYQSQFYHDMRSGTIDDLIQKLENPQDK